MSSSEDEIPGLAFDVGEEMEPTSEPPLDGFEYLRQVKWQAKRIPNVVTARTKPVVEEPSILELIAATQIPKASPAVLPTIEWREHVYREFEQLRVTLEGLENFDSHRSYTKMEWKALCFGANGQSGTHPSDSLLCSLDHLNVTRFLNWTITRAEGRLTTQECFWLYGLLARASLPMDADQMAQLRDLLRTLARRRVRLDANNPLLPPVNVLITVIEDYFGQGDR